MKRASSFKRHELIGAAALIAAHATYALNGFRQRDVKFLMELFGNWIQYSIGEEELRISNMQIARNVEEVLHAGLGRKISSRDGPRYQLTRAGVVDLLGRFWSERLYKRPSLMFFAHYFLSSYRPVIMRLVEQDGNNFPAALRIELEYLLDIERFRSTQLAQAKREFAKLEIRIKDSIAMAKLTQKLGDTKTSYLDIVKAVERDYPYELNSQKPLSEFFFIIPEDQGRWELGEGGVERANKLWHPMFTLWQMYISLL